MYDREAEKGKSRLNVKKSMNGGFLSVNRLYYSNKQFCSIFKILLFSNGHESNQIENKMPNLVQEYAHHPPYYA